MPWCCRHRPLGFLEFEMRYLQIALRQLSNDDFSMNGHLSSLTPLSLWGHNARTARPRRADDYDATTAWK